MSVVSLVLEVRLPGCHAPKQRRQEVDAILLKLREHFNVSVIDLNRDAPGEVAAMGFATFAKNRREARSILDRIADAVSAHPRVEILKASFENQ